MSFSVLTYNIKKAKGFRGTIASITDIASHISAQHCDVVLCQEVAEIKDDKHGSHCCQLATELHMDHDYGANAFYETGSHGNATFSSLPITHRLNLDITLSPLEHRGVLYSVIEVSKGISCHFFNMHLGLTPGQRRKQLNLILSYIEENIPNDAPVIIAGDFNDFDGMLRRKIKSMPDFQSVSPSLGIHCKTWPSHLPKLQLDQIIFRNLTLIAAAVINEEPTHCLSDHLAIRAEFSL